MSSAHSAPGSTSRFAGALIDLLDRVEYRRVTADDQFDPIYRLRYEAYRREDFIPITDQQMVRDAYDDLPNCYAFGVYIDDELVSSVRFHYLTSDFRSSPNHSLFPDILDPLLDAGHTILDPGRFTADREASLAFPSLPFLTLRLPTLAVLHFGTKYCLNSVRPEHGAFYRRVYQSVALAEPRSHDGVGFPVALYACDVPVIYPGLLRRYPFFRSTEAERNALFGADGQSSLARIRPTARVAHRLAELEMAPA